jgi:hypothetical protein
MREYLDCEGGANVVNEKLECDFNFFTSQFKSASPASLPYQQTPCLINLDHSIPAQLTSSTPAIAASRATHQHPRVDAALQIWAA